MNSTDNDGVVVHAGFPNPATDKSLGSLDLNKLLVRRAVSTYFFRIEGDSWQDIGVFNNDIAVIDRALDPHTNDVVVWWDETNGVFSLSHYKNTPKTATIWGVVTSTIHQLREK